MNTDAFFVPEELVIIAGRGIYPLTLAESARRQGVRKIFAAAFKKETEREIEKLADETQWFNFGQLGAVLEAVKASGIKQAVMAGQITPVSLFRLRPDAKALKILTQLNRRNARTIFGAICA